MKIKYLGIAAFVILTLSSFTDGKYVINGKVESAECEGLKVYKIERAKSAAEGMKMDSTVIKNRAYTFSGTTTEPDYCSIYVRKEGQRDPVAYVTVVVEEGGKYNVATDAKQQSRVTGSAMNDALQKCIEDERKISERFQAIFAKEDKAKKEGIELSQEEKGLMENELSELRFLLTKTNYNFVKNNINNPGAWSKLHNAGVLSKSIQEQKDLIAGADERTKQLNDYKIIVDRINTLERTAIGQRFIDFTMNDQNGKEVKLSDFAGKGKYVLIDFWASWCGPCRAEMPNVIATYNQFKDKGLEIVGVSLDSKKEAWVKAIEQMKLPWKHMSDLKGWGCEGAKLFAVTGVPCTILLDKEGKIIARDLRGDKLYKKLNELMK